MVTAAEHPSQRLTIFQGDYNALGSTVDAVAKRLSPSDVVVLTHAFTVGQTPAMEVELSHGKCLDTAYRDAKGAGIRELIVELRKLNPKVKIFGYVSATADHPLSCWSSAREAQNYSCPDEGKCQDFERWMNAWRNLESSNKPVRIDGFFVDMVNEVHVSQKSWRRMQQIVHSAERELDGGRYQIIANTLAVEPSAFYRDGGNTMIMPKLSPISFASQFLQTGDAVLVEGFFLRSGELQSQTSFQAMKNDLFSAFQNRGVGFVAIASTNPGTLPRCDSFEYRASKAAFENLSNSGALAFTFQAADLGTTSRSWLTCPQ